ncbi:MAG: S-methyl-5-thioribose-1-phosphate isomerase [Holophagales bacterium]|nr:MAG: S-methyl-5-thioribose-1-phosphate isomerase [Holophagales bacterium]
MTAHLAPDEVVPLRWANGALSLLDQTRLPHEERWLEVRSVDDLAEAIVRLAVRGAPAIGIAAAYGVAIAAASGGRTAAAAAIPRLDATRPTAVNLRWALDRQAAVLQLAPDAGLAAALLTEAQRIEHEDRAACKAMGDHGAGLFGEREHLLTHCNAGALATGGFGTALGVIRAAWLAGKVERVFVDETRPLLQGARLTSWELGRLGIPHRLVTDSSVGALMSRGLVTGVVVGADRIAANGDTANKIGTYTVAALAARHGVPFYVAAPRSTVDRRIPNGTAIPIEERCGIEVEEIGGIRLTPRETSGLNFAFDVTPHDLIAAIITEAGVLRPPYDKSLAAALAADGNGRSRSRQEERCRAPGTAPSPGGNANR